MIETYDTNYKRTSQTTEVDDIRTTIEVVQVENGYIVTKEQYDKSEYKTLSKKCWISKEDPLENKKASLLDAIKNIKLTEGTDSMNKIS